MEAEAEAKGSESEAKLREVCEAEADSVSHCPWRFVRCWSRSLGVTYRRGMGLMVLGP